MPAKKAPPQKIITPAKPTLARPFNAAALRFLAALDSIPDNSAGSDREFMRALDKGRPHRPLFRGKH